MGTGRESVAASTVIRPRRRADIPELARLLMEQQPRTRYPFRNPLPFPVEQFLHADDAAAAWVAEHEGRVAGHACWTGSVGEFPQADRIMHACAGAHGCAVSALAWVSALFVGEHARGHGIGRLLLDTVVLDIRGAAAFPCLEVLPVHQAARQLYLSAGWREVMTCRPAWLTEIAGDDGADVHVMVHVA